MNITETMLSELNEIIQGVHDLDGEKYWYEHEAMESCLSKIQRIFSKYEENCDVFIEKAFLLIEDLNNFNVYYHIATFLMNLSKSPEICNRVLLHIIKDRAITWENKYFLYWQISRMSFLSPEKFDEESGNLIERLYTQIFEKLKNEIQNELFFVPKEERNENLVFVITSQFLSLLHGPTKTTLDRSEVIQSELKKKVFILNTADILNTTGIIGCYNMALSNYQPHWSKVESVPYNGNQYSYLQCEKNQMPDISVIRSLLCVVQEEKPFFILNVGGDNIFADLCSSIVPTIALATVPSGRSITRGQFQIVGHEIREEDKEWMVNRGLPLDHMIQCLFTSSFKKQEHHYTRRELNLQEDAFIVTLVGGRLDAEIDDKLESIMEHLMEQGIYFVFMGTYQRFSQLVEERPIFQYKGIDLGFQDDVLAVYECCDLYLNPKRIGGGTSVAEALYKGLPVVTFNYGDGGLGAGADFWCEDYQEMEELILRYKQDRGFYEQQRQKAIARAQKLTDSKHEFVNALNKIMQSPRF